MTLPSRVARLCSLTGVIAAFACGSTGSVSTFTPTLHCTIHPGGGAEPVPPDGASLCAPGVCNYQSQSGCAETETCGPLIDTTKKTVTPACRTPGTRGRGEACDAQNGCAKGHYCVNQVCRKLCCGGDWTACDAGESCIHQVKADVDGLNGKGTIVDAQVSLCVPVNNCDVLDPDSCSDQKRTCRIVDPTGAVACAPPSTLKAGDPCDSQNQCGPVLHCVDPDSIDGTTFTSGVCRKLCSYGACGQPSCGPGEGVCVHFRRDPEGVGECTPGWQGPAITVDAGVPSDLDAAVHRPDAR